MNLKADTAERLIAPPGAPTPARRSLVPAALSVLFHVSVVAILLYEQSLMTSEPPRDEEIPVEVIVEPPPPPPQEPPPEPEPPQPQPKEKPPQQKIVDDEKPAFDAPRAANRETVERESPDQETKSERAAPPNDQLASKPSPEKNPDPEQQAATSSEPRAALLRSEDDKPDAEIVDKAEPKQEEKQEEKQGQVEVKASPEPKALKSIADQIASLEALPDYKLAGASKPAPVSGGTARTSYLSILFGMIVPHFHVPPNRRGKTAPNLGLVAFYIDEMGHLTHQVVYRSSGFSDLDAAALAAVRRAAPFPAPPRGHARTIVFQFTR